ncbi:hypothetical protein GCM10029992_16990 [Glycomyces albus]
MNIPEVNMADRGAAANPNTTATRTAAATRSASTPRWAQALQAPAPTIATIARPVAYGLARWVPSRTTAANARAPHSAPTRRVAVSAEPSRAAVAVRVWPSRAAQSRPTERERWVSSGCWRSDHQEASTASAPTRAPVRRTARSAPG